MNENLQLNFFQENDDEKKKAQEEINELRKQINYYNKKYYEEDNSELSDYAYDKLTTRLRVLENRFPDLVTKDSPTQKVGGKIKSSFESVSHDIQMQSLQDVFSFDEVRDFVEKTIEEYGKDTKFCVETKIDGLSVSLEYEKGKLKRGSTRGDGFVGEDVTQNLKMIKDIPDSLKSDDTIEIRGEVYLPRKEFEKINEKLYEAGKPLLSNPRNAAAGTLRQLDVELVKNRNLSIFVFNVQKGGNFKSHFESLDYLEKIGVKVIEKRKICVGVEEVLDYISYIGKIRDELEYDIDGAVVKVDDLNIRNEMGKTVKVPKWAVAYKYPPEQKETVIKDIALQVGRTGQVTPLAILNPVRLAGSVISKTTLHNFDYITSKDIRVGDHVIIEKAGDVIPEVVDVVTNKRDGTQKKYNIPTNCPVCKEELEKEENGVALRCTNSECPASLYRSLVHFVSRDCMDITGLGESLIETLLEKSLIRDIADIYTLKYEDLLGLENFAELKASNIISSINKSKENTLDKLIFGLGIRHIGKKAAKVLALNFDDIKKIGKASVEELSSLEDFGKIMAESVYNFFQKEQTKKLIEKLDGFGVNLKGMKKVLASTKLENMVICITGSFDDISREDIIKLVEENGGKASTSVSKKTTYLVAGQNAGSKLKKAEELKVKIITLDEFRNLLKE